MLLREALFEAVASVLTPELATHPGSSVWGLSCRRAASGKDNQGQYAFCLPDGGLLVVVAGVGLVYAVALDFPPHRC